MPERDERVPRDRAEGSDEASEDTPAGAGSEAAAGLEAFAQDGDQLLSRSTPPGGTSGASSTPGDVERAGSEPLPGTGEQHESGYGGRDGQPRTSSDQRERLDYEGSGGAH